VIICQKCAKENQDHYKFCLGCGAELPREVAARAPNTPSHGVKPGTSNVLVPGVSGAPGSPNLAGLSSGAGVPVIVVPAGASGSVTTPGVVAGAASGAKVPCPQCSHLNGGGNIFCGSCGFRLMASVSPAAPVAQSKAPEGPGLQVVLTALRADGSEAGVFTLPNANITVGRETGGIFAADSYLSPRHATFRADGKRLFIKDEASLNGVYRKLTRDTPVELGPSDVFRIGQEIIKFEPLEKVAPSPDGVERLGAPAKGYIGRIALVVGRDTTGNAFPVPDTGVHLGRERGEVLFPEDGYVSGLHCRIAPEGSKIFLTDLGSSNGTFLRLNSEAEIVSGDVLLMGQQLFRISI
jgi:pSer/pThr/pTyr-binding forkhead associated (FHA) protein